MNAGEKKQLIEQQIRESLLQELEESQQAIRELSDEQLQEVAGGFLMASGPQPKVVKRDGHWFFDFRSN